MRKQSVYSMRRFRCLTCGAEMSAAKMVCRTGKGHVKTMYCYVCKKERDFEQIDMDRAK